MYQENTIIVKIVEQKSDFLNQAAYTTLIKRSMPMQFVPQGGDLLVHDGNMYCVMQRIWYELHSVPRLKIYVRKSS